MKFDDLTRRYFGTDSLDLVQQSALQAGIERMQVDLGLEQERAQRFALWSLLFMLDAAPDLDVAFKDAIDRDAARNFMDLASSDPDDEPV